MSLENVLLQSAVVASGIAGVLDSYGTAPEAINQFPCHVSFPASGGIEAQDSSWDVVSHQILLILYVARADQPTSINDVVPFLHKYQVAFSQHVQLNGACRSAWIRTYKMGRLKYADTSYVALQMTMDVVEEQGITRIP
jgi:hypothetical protein